MSSPERQDAQSSEEEDDNRPADPPGGNVGWYNWSRWKYFGTALFLTLTAIGTGFVIWDELEQIPVWQGWPTVRILLRELPGRIASMAGVAGLIAYGPPAGVDLMIGATKAVEEWIRKRHAKARAEGRTEGRAEAQSEERQRIMEALMPLAEDNPELKKRLDELTNGDTKH